MAHLQLILFGGFKAALEDGGEIDVLRRAARLVLARLACHPGEPVERTVLANLFWGGSGEAEARGSLRQAVAALRKALVPVGPSLLASVNTLTLVKGSADVDVADFERLCGVDDTASWEKAARLYRGPFLAGLEARSPEGERWITSERLRLQEEFIKLTERLIEIRQRAGLPEQAIAAAEMLLRHDPLREDVHRAVMQLYATLGRRAQAISQYEACREALKRELGVAPEPDTELLLRQIQRQNAETPKSPAPTGESAVTPSIAVLPFAAIGDDPEQDHFAMGLTEDIITDLSQVSGLAVLAGYRVFSLRGKSVQIQQAARELKVHYVLEGSVRKVGARLRITAQLVDGATGSHLWSHRYDRDLADVFALQDEISRSIVDVLRIKLMPSEKETLGRHPTRNVEAYDFYLMGRSFYLRGLDQRNLAIARALFARAVEIDPRYAHAIAAMAICDSYIAYKDPNAWIETALATVGRALVLDPALAEAYAARGLAFYAVGRYCDAGAEFDRAIALNPDLFEANFFKARTYRLRGQREEAMRLLWRASELRPDDFRSLGLYAEDCRMIGRADEFEGAARRTVERLIQELKRHPDNADAWAFGSALLAQLDERRRAQDWAARASIMGPDDYLVHYNLARTALLLGRLPEALDWLERAFAGPPVFRRRLAGWIPHCSEISSLSSHPRVKPLLNAS